MSNAVTGGVRTVEAMGVMRYAAHAALVMGAAWTEVQGPDTSFPLQHPSVWHPTPCVIHMRAALPQSHRFACVGASRVAHPVLCHEVGSCAWQKLASFWRFLRNETCSYT